MVHNHVLLLEYTEPQCGIASCASGFTPHLHIEKAGQGNGLPIFLLAHDMETGVNMDVFPSDSSGHIAE